MVCYYGRGKTQTQMSTNQPGLKMGGCASTVGKKGYLARSITRRACSGSTTVCGLSGGGFNCRHGVRGTWSKLITDKYCKKQSNPCFTPQAPSASIGGGVGRHYPMKLY